MCSTMSLLMSLAVRELGYGAGPNRRLCPSFIQGWAMISGILILFSGLEISRRCRRSLQPSWRGGGGGGGGGGVGEGGGRRWGSGGDEEVGEGRGRRKE